MRVRALRDLHYATREYKAGEEFDTETEMHGTLMIAAQSVEVAQQQSDKQRGRYKRRDMRADE